MTVVAEPKTRLMNMTESRQILSYHGFQNGRFNESNDKAGELSFTADEKVENIKNCNDRHRRRIHNRRVFYASGAIRASKSED